MLLAATDRWHANGGGRERYLEELVRYLSARGRHVAVLCGSREAAATFTDCTVQPGVRSLRDARLRAAVRQARTAKPELQVLALSPISGATHYQMHDGVFEQAFAAERDLISSRVRRTLFPIGLAFNRHRRRLMHDQRLLVSEARSVMAFSRATARDAVDRFGVKPDRLVIEPPGVDLLTFRPERADPPIRSPNELRLAFVAHNFALKGLHTAMEALGQLRRLGVRAGLTVAGAGQTRHYRSLAKRIGVAPNVRFAGSLAADSVADLYRNSDLLVHPTFYDPFPRVVIEALACGCPVITTGRCGASEALVHGENGYIVDDPRDAAVIAGLAAGLTDSSRLAAMRRAAARSGEQYNAAVHFDRVIEWLKSTPVGRTI